MSKAGFIVTFVAAGAVVATQSAEHPMGNMTGKALIGAVTQGSSTASHIGPAYLASPTTVVNMVTDDAIFLPADLKPGLTVGSTELGNARLAFPERLDPFEMIGRQRPSGLAAWCEYSDAAVPTH